MSTPQPKFVFLIALSLASFAGCKAAETAPDAAVEPIPLPTPASSSPAAPTAAAPTTPVPGAATTTTTVTPASPKADAGVVADAGATLDAGKTTDAGATTPDAGASSAGKAQACFDQCQKVMQGCLTAGIGINDAGVPVFKDPTACQKATDACKASCQ